MEYIQIGRLRLSRFILGGNPFSGFSHQSAALDEQMKRYYTYQQIKQTLSQAEKLGIDTVISRADNHIIRLLFEYWNEGGKMQWFAQTCPEFGPSKLSIKRAVENGAKACHIHGGVTDHLLAHGRLKEILPAINMIRQGGMLAGLAGHRPEVFEWAEKNADVDYYMCSYYDPTPREDTPEHISGDAELFDEKDRAAMASAIKKLSKPVIHYKIMAAGRNEPASAFAYAAKHMRDRDAVCVGVYTENKPDMLKENVRLFE